MVIQLYNLKIISRFIIKILFYVILQVIWTGNVTQMEKCGKQLLQCCQCTSVAVCQAQGKRLSGLALISFVAL